uniref:hypothetical protein n=1 Tax=Gracilinema caldarium TaxID=215591 RepID=UPI0026F03A1C
VGLQPLARPARSESEFSLLEKVVGLQRGEAVEGILRQFSLLEKVVGLQHRSVYVDGAWKFSLLEKVVGLQLQKEVFLLEL